MPHFFGHAGSNGSRGSKIRRVNTYVAVDPSKWCITREDLDLFEYEVRQAWRLGQIPNNPEYPNEFHDDPEIGPNIYQVNEYFIKPRTLEADTSWALMRNPDGLSCDAFVTHGWAEGIFEFTYKVRRMWPGDAKHLYCCFLSNPQNGDVSAMVGDDPLASPFAKALHSARYFLVVSNQQQSIYERLWCVLEAYLALKQKKRILVYSIPPRRRYVLLVTLPLMLGVFILGSFAIRRRTILFASYRVQDAVQFFAWVAIPCYILCAEPLNRRFPKISSLTMCFVTAFVSGLGTVDPQDRNSGVPMYRLVVDALLEKDFSVVTFCVFVYAAIAHALQVLSAETLATEKMQLHFESVSNAMCSYDRDMQQIRAVIRGEEEKIDEEIRMLQVVGHHDDTVQFNISRGMQPSRVRDGIMPALVYNSACLWVRVITRILVRMATFSCARHRTQSTQIAYAIIAYFLPAVIVIVVWCVGDVLIFITDAFLWGSVLVYATADVLAAFMAGKDFRWSTVPDEQVLDEFLQCQQVIVITSVAGLVLFCAIPIGTVPFYLRLCGRRNRDDDYDSSEDASGCSGDDPLD